MATIKAVIGNYQKQDGNKPIYLQYVHNEKKAWIATGILIPPPAFNKKKQSINQASLLRADKATRDLDSLYLSYVRLDKALNKNLQEKVNELKAVVAERKTEKLPLDIESVKAAFVNKDKNQAIGLKPITEAINEYLTYHNEFSVHTVKGYKTTLGKIEAFAKSIKVPVLTVGYLEEAKNLEAFKKFVEKGLSKTTGAANNIKRVKAVLKHLLEDKGDYKAVKVHTTKAGDRFVEYLTSDELVTLSKFDDESKPNLMEAKDMFLFMAGTGLRISDAKMVESGMIRYQNDRPFLNIVTEKTEDRILVPLSAIAVDMLKRRNYVLPTMSEPYLNRQLKVLFALPELGLEAKRMLTEKVNNKNETVTKNRSDLITTRAAKVSFVMWLIDARLSDDEICGITGNTVKTLQHYKAIRPERSFNTIDRADLYLKTLKG